MHPDTKSQTHNRIDPALTGDDPASLRHQALQCARNFKTSWVELGQTLYAVWKDKAYKQWGYITFDAYTAKEIGIKKQTAMKLLKSYYFLEKEEPEVLSKEHAETASPTTLPSYEAVDVLRLAKENEAVDRVEYNRLKKEVFENGKEPREVKKDLTSLIRQRQELDPEEAREKKRSASIKRFLGTLKALKTELETGKLVSSTVIREMQALIAKIEHEAA